jgi:hypothetical protein
MLAHRLRLVAAGSAGLLAGLALYSLGRPATLLTALVPVLGPLPPFIQLPWHTNLPSALFVFTFALLALAAAPPPPHPLRSCLGWLALAWLLEGAQLLPAAPLDGVPVLAALARGTFDVLDLLFASIGSAGAYACASASAAGLRAARQADTRSAEGTPDHGASSARPRRLNSRPRLRTALPRRFGLPLLVAVALLAATATSPRHSFGFVTVDPERPCPGSKVMLR